MDSEYLILAIFLTLIGVAGIVVFSGPMTPSGDSCYCIIPSAEPGAMQGTASILLIFGVMFFPIGIFKGGLPQRRKSVPAPRTVGSGRVYTPVSVSSGGLFAFGLLLLFLAMDFVVIPSYLVLHSLPLMGVGLVLTAIGALLAYAGVRARKQ